MKEKEDEKNEKKRYNDESFDKAHWLRPLYSLDGHLKNE